MTFREATDLLGMPLEDIATATGRTYGTVLAYRRGDRQAPSEVMHALGRLARERGGELQALADELQRGGELE